MASDEQAPETIPADELARLRRIEEGGEEGPGRDGGPAFGDDRAHRDRRAAGGDEAAVTVPLLAAPRRPRKTSQP
jgi:hypothetical protein